MTKTRKTQNAKTKPQQAEVVREYGPFPGRDEVNARNAERSGRDLGEIEFFVALGYWKLAIILEGVYSRYAKGQYGKPEDGFEEFGKNVGRLAEAADEAVDRLG